MGLIKNKLNKLKRNKLFWERFGSKATTITLTSSIVFSTLFGLVGCNYNKTPEIDTSQSEDRQEILELKSSVQALKEIATTLGVNNSEFEKEIAELENRITDIEKGEDNSDAVISELRTMVEDLQNDVKVLMENNANADSQINEEVVSRLAKLQASLAINQTFKTQYMKVQVGDNELITAPNGDLASFSEDGEYAAHYNKELKTLFELENGQERFNNLRPEDEDALFNYDELGEGIIGDSQLTFDQAQSDENKFIFKNKEDESTMITITFNYGHVESVVTNDMVITNSDQEVYENTLRKVRETLKLIGIYEEFAAELDAALAYKYMGVSAESNKGGSMNGVCAGKLLAYEDKLSDGSFVYTLTSVDGDAHVCRLEGDEVVKEATYSGAAYNQKEEIKNYFKSITDFSCQNTISYDSATETYSIKSKSYEKNIVTNEIRIKFNEDLSIDFTEWDYDNGEPEIITYKIEKISKQKFNEIYNKIAAIVENAKQQEDGLTQ